MNQRRGFTLIELSIVLVIIGLIAGGVLVGLTLIEAAAVRAQVSQLNQFTAAVNTFRVKYNAVPGDILFTEAAAFGMAARSGAPGHGDGDHILGQCLGTYADLTSAYFGCEDALFWNDLSFAGLINGSFAADVDSPGNSNTIQINAGQQSLYLPDAKLGNGASVAVFTMDGNEVYHSNIDDMCGYGTFCYAVVRVKSTTSSGGITGWYDVQGGVSPAQAFAIDTKLDDGIPNTGIVRGSNPSLFFGGPTSLTLADPTISVSFAAPCLTAGGSSGRAYNLDPANVSNPLNIKSPFCVLHIANK